MPADGAARVRFLFHCWLLLIAAAALCDEAAAQGSTCGTQDPGQVDPIPDAVARSSTGNSITLDWNPPNDDWDTDYYYIVSCLTCPTKQANTTDETYTFSDLTAATEYSFSIEAGRWDCSLSNPFDLPGKTALTNIPGPVHITDVAETSFRAHWAASPDVGVEYEVNRILTVQNTSYVFSGQESGARIEVIVRPVKTGFPKANQIFGTAFTKLFAIDVNSVKVDASETAISVSWHPSNTSNVFYLLTCTRVGSGDVTNVNSSVPSATCSSLQSGEAYRLSVAVKKEGRFDDAVTPLPNQLLTKLIAIDASSVQFVASETAICVSWQAPNIADASYQLTCRRVGSGDVTNVTSSSPSATCGSLESGQTYQLTVTVKKAGGFDDAVTQLPNQLTKLFPIDASSAQIIANETAISVSWHPSNTSDVFYQLICRRVGSGDVTNVTSSSPSATCGSLESGQRYEVTVAVKKDGGFEDAVTPLPDQQTKLFAVDPSSARFVVKVTSIDLSWGASATEGVRYQATCWQVSTGDSIVLPESTGVTGTFNSLQSGEAYNLSVAVTKTGFEEAVTWLPTQLTKLFAIDSSSAQFNGNETAISVSWRASSTAGVSYQLTCIQVGSGDVTNVTSSSSSATCSSLQSGENYTLTVAVKKAGGFDDAVSQLPNQLTKLFSVDASTAAYSVNESAISVSWTASATSGVSHQLQCRSGDSTVLRNASSPDHRLSAICDSLQPGQDYRLQLVVMKDGGFEDAVTELEMQLTLPVLSSDSASFTAAAAAVPLNNSLPAEAVLQLNWTSNSAHGADLLRFRVRSSAMADLVTEAPFGPLQQLLSLSEAELFSQKLSVTVAAVANKSGLRQESPEISIADQLQMPPNRPSMSLTADKRAIKVKLTASSSSELMKAAILTDGAAFDSAASCHPDTGSGTCTVTFQPLRPHSNNSVEAVAEISSLPSLPQLSVVRTLEDPPTQPTSVRLNAASSRLLCEWRTPSEPNGVIRNYTVKWGSLNFTDSVELPGGVETVAANSSSLELPEPPLPGHAYFCRVSACTGGGCSRDSDRAEVQLADGEAAAVAIIMVQAVPGGTVNVNWKPLSPLVGQGVVFEYALRLDGPGGCSAALQLNCSDCGRHRQQLQSDEAWQRLEDLTRNCAAPVSVRAFSFYDTELVLEVPVSSQGGSPNSLKPWTEYSASLWPVNLAGPGAVRSVPFRSPETPSEAVRSLRATPSEAEALVEFEEPELANGLLQAFAVQLFTSASVCPQILVLKSTSAPGCQLTKCSTEQFLKKLTDECNSASTAAPIVTMRNSALSNSGKGSSLTVRVQQLQPGTEYSVRVTPVSQTLPGAATVFKFVTAGGGGGGNAVTIVVAVVISVLVVFSISAAVVVFVRRRQQNSGPQQTAPASSAADNLPKDAFNDYVTVAAATADPTDYVKMVPVKGQVQYKC